MNDQTIAQDNPVQQIPMQKTAKKKGRWNLNRQSPRLTNSRRSSRTLKSFQAHHQKMGQKG